MFLYHHEFFRAYLNQTVKPLILAFEFRLLVTYISCSLGRLENTFASMTSKASFCEISLKNSLKVIES